MGKSLSEMKAGLSPERQLRIQERAEELEADVLTLAQLRKALGLTQKQIAETMDVGQDVVSKVERRTDMLLSTLKNFVSAAGGELHMVAKFPDRSPIEIESLGDLKEADTEKALPV